MHAVYFNIPNDYIVYRFIFVVLGFCGKDVIIRELPMSENLVNEIKYFWYLSLESTFGVLCESMNYFCQMIQNEFVKWFELNELHENDMDKEGSSMYDFQFVSRSF